ncbi:MAG: 30S ribosomal protein S14 [Bdellovibrionaceae bacterium]|nr:30S ribosomal protein S14 [Pseudobdellovibrionaceae bacterium]|tara:strand:+ start:804 stop:1109 length:306 start_codon:yes stop_codon:yes gene_type:complete
MAKKSAVVKNNKRKELSTRYYKYRQELRDQLKSPDTPDEDRLEIQFKLQKLRRDTAPIRVRNRCHLTGRPRGFLRKFGLSRIAVREYANFGRLPGVTKSSW